MDTPPIGSRLSLSGNLGTVRYTGPVNGTSGTWLGVEWDDSRRGKHDGVKDGKRYFQCRGSNSGSFIRPNAKGLSYGVSFLDALMSKYVDTLHGSSAQEKVILGSSQGAIEVEAVNLDKIRSKFAQVDRLREVSLDGEMVARADELGLIKQACPNIRGLDLSQNLLVAWDQVASITSELPLLQRLSLNRNKLHLPQDCQTMARAFLNLTELQLNATFTTWPEMEKIIAFIPSLLIVELGYNTISSPLEASSLSIANSKVHTLNFDSNLLSDWTNICSAVSRYRCLERLVLTGNTLADIAVPQQEQHILLNLKSLSLSENEMRSWSSIDALSLWCPTLEALTVSGNPLAEGATSQHYRQFIVSRIPSLRILDATQISNKQRTDCELFYLSYIAQHGPESVEEKMKEHPQWENLRKKHGDVETAPSRLKNKKDNLGSRLIELNFIHCSIPLNVKESAVHQTPRTGTIRLRVLPSMTLRSLRLKLSKTLKLNINTTIMLWLEMDGGNSVTELTSERDGQDMEWLGLEQDSNIFYYTNNT